MKEIETKFLLAEDKFMPEMHLKQPGFTYGACGPFTKNKEKIQSLKKHLIQIIFTKMILIKLFFSHDTMAYGKYKDLNKRKQSEKLLRNKAFEIASNPKLASMVFKFFDKKTSGGAIKSMSNQQLARELHKPIFRNF